jgi:hypothetical protein
MTKGGNRAGSGRKPATSDNPAKPTKSFAADLDNLELIDSAKSLGFKNQSALINFALRLLQEKLKK